MIKVALIGVGKTGSQVAKSIIESKLDLVAAFAAPGDDAIGKEIEGVKISSAAELSKVLEEVKPDVVVDFTNAAALMKNLSTIVEKKINLVVGTTGFTDVQIEEIEKAGSEIGVVLSPNMSVGVNVFFELCREAAKKLKDYDVELIDKHHRFKKDAPSGTALKAAEMIAEEKGVKQKFTYGREGKVSRDDNEIGIHAIRAGNIVGEHTVIFANQKEKIELTHVAHTREAFSSGVPKAVEFIVGKKGVYGMKKVLEE